MATHLTPAQDFCLKTSHPGYAEAFLAPVRFRTVLSKLPQTARLDSLLTRLIRTSVESYQGAEW